MKIHPDDPLKDPSQDALGHSSFAFQLAQSIKYMPKEGAVLAIHGPWGSGKTSVLNLIHHYLKQHPDNCPLVVSFNPWWFSGQEDLTMRFFAALKEALKNADIGDLANMLLDFGELASEANVPWQLKAAYKVFSQFNKKCIQKYSLIDQKREVLVNALQNQNQKILVLIDDIDRLTAEEIRQIFKLVKSVANFPNIIYLLAFDENVVAQALEDSQSIAGREYLKKIVQVPFELPRPEKSELITLLCNNLNQLLVNVPQTSFDQERWHVALEGIKYYINTPRDVVRLINTLNVTYPCVSNEVNPVDFVALESIRVFTPDVYHLIQTTPSLFCGCTDKQDKFDISSLKRSSNEQTALKDILQTLFPKLKIAHYDASWLEKWRKNLQICSPDCFPVYFRLAVPIGAISNMEMLQALSIAKNSEAFAALLLKLSTEKGLGNHTRVHGFLHRLNDFTQNEIPTENIPQIISAFFMIGDKLLGPEDRKQSFWDVPGNDLCMWWIISNLLKRIPENDRIKIINESIDASKEISFMFLVVAYLKKEHLEGAVPPTEKPDHIITNPNDLNLFFKKVIEKTREAAKESTLFATPHLPFVLNNWKVHGEVEEMQNWLDSVLAQNTNLIKFLNHFFSTSFQMNPTTNFSKTLQSFHLKSLDLIIDPKRIINQARVIQAQTLNSEKTPESITGFIRAYELRVEGKEDDAF